RAQALVERRGCAALRVKLDDLELARVWQATGNRVQLGQVSDVVSGKSHALTRRRQTQREMVLTTAKRAAVADKRLLLATEVLVAHVDSELARIKVPASGLGNDRAGPRIAMLRL